MLNIQKLSFAFGKHQLYHDLDIQFMPGHVTGVVGANGVGKTTLFRIIAGIYKIQHGTLLLNNKKFSSSDVAFMPTEPFFYPYMKGYEYLQIVANTNDELKKSEKYADRLQLPLNELVDNYSTGMKKKLAFSAIFSLQKRVIILDEPYNGVDLHGNEIMKHLIKTESEEKVVILSSHILHTLLDICDRIYHFAGNTEVDEYFRAEFKGLESKIKEDIVGISE